MNQKVVILGGYGAFGSKIAMNLAKLPAVSLVIAGRSRQKGEIFASSIGAEYIFCDLKEEALVRQVVDDAFLVIHAAGPFSGTTHSVARICLEQGAHYLDLGDERVYVAGIATLNEQAERKALFLCSGASTAPGVTSAMVQALAADGLRIHAIHSVLSPGNQNPRGVSTVATVLGYLGRSIAMTVDGQDVKRSGWFDGETITLPPPVGRRRVYTVDTPDLSLFPAYFGAYTVTFKAGLELNVMNHSLTILARARRQGWLPSLTRLAKIFTILSWPLYPLGSSHGAAAVWVEGEKDGQLVKRSLAIVAPTEGPLVAAAPVILLAQQLLDGRLMQRGAFPCLGLLAFDELMTFLEQFGMQAIWGDDRGWRQ